MQGFEVDSSDDEWEEDIHQNYGRGYGLLDPDEQLDVRLDIQGTVEHAFQHYDVLVGDHMEHCDASQEAPISEANVHASQETQRSNGQAKNDNPTSFERMPCEPDPIED